MPSREVNRSIVCRLRNPEPLKAQVAAAWATRVAQAAAISSGETMTPQRTLHDLMPGEHLCWYCETEAALPATLKALIVQGLEQGEKVLYLSRAHAPAQLLARLREAGCNPTPYLASGQLRFLTSQDAPALLDPEAWPAFLQEEVLRATREGYSALRLLNEMAWDAQLPPEKWLALEQALDRFRLGNRVLAVCIYGREGAPADILLDALSLHPLVVSGEAIVQNGYYLPAPDSAEDPARALLERRLEALRTREEAPERIARAFRTLTECNRVLVTATDEESLLQAFCRTLVQVGGYRLAWIGVAEEGKTVTPVAQAGFEEGYLTSVKITWDESEYGRGPTGTAIRTGRPCIARDIPSDAQYAPWRAEALRRGYASSIALPIFLGGRVYGALNIYAREPDAFGAIEVSLLSNLAEDLAYGISALRTSAEHREVGLERSHLLVQLREQARQMQRIVEAVPEGVLLLDAERRIALANPAARAYLRALAGADVGQVLTRLGERPLEEILDPQDNGKDIHEVTTNGAARRAFEVSAQPVENGSGVGGWVLVIREVTRQREQQARIEQQQRLAAMGQLAAGIAHDLNNVLQGILSFADLLRQEPGLPDSAQEPLRLIMQLAERAARVNRQILDFTRQSVSEKHPLNLVPFARETVYLLQRMIPEHIAVSLEYASGEYWVNADVAQLQQVLINLATNARDAMPEGGRLTVRLSRHEFPRGAQFPAFRLPPGDWVRLEVSDSGHGIPPEILPRVFEPFFTTKERGQGTGLGLAQVYGIVKQHDGYIDITSRVGQGTTVTIYLPALPDDLESLFRRSEEAVPRGKGELVLVVEDDPAVLEAARSALERLNYRTLAATDGRQALELFRRHRSEIALVLADLVMPDVGGIVLCNALREIDPEARVLLLSGYPLDTQVRLLSPHGVVGWLQKPFDLEALAWAMSRALAGKRSAS